MQAFNKLSASGNNGYSYITKDAKIWVENPERKTYSEITEEPYLLATVIRHDDNKREVEVKYLDRKRGTANIKYEKSMQFINDPSINENDMAAVEDINEVDLLNNLKNRSNNCTTFTNVGPTLIIVNPYQKLEGVYGESIIDNFIVVKNKSHRENNPNERKQITNSHLYDLVLIAINHLNENKKNQVIVISGESGAGKTETAKNAMKCITYYYNKYGNLGRSKKVDNSATTSLENQILGCNPILEAFGNAKTLRNDNSSRFGKYVTINLDIETGVIDGAQIQTYLLEKSRVCEQNEGERNYHIFYHLLKGADISYLNELFLTNDPNQYQILSLSNCVSVETIDDEMLFHQVVNAFKITGFSDTEINTIYQIISSCLLLGNLTFSEVQEKAQIDDKDKDNDGLFTHICKLLDCDPQTLEIALTANVRTIQGQVIITPLRLSDALHYRNAFIKELYNRVFSWIVKKLNKQLAPNINMKNLNKKYIGLLDIFGFECFQINSFEQMCINFTNEKLQQLYINDIFKAEEQEFIREALKDFLGMITFKDNQQVIDLMDKAGSGLFQSLDDMCLTNKDDKTYLATISKNHQNSTSVFKVPKISGQNKFTIFHTAKDVEYSVNGFVVKNLDEVKSSMMECLYGSKNQVIRYIFTNSLDEKEYQRTLALIEEEKNNNNFKKEVKYLGGKFRVEMNSLMEELAGCECHYIRCLKPNEFKKKDFFVPTFVFLQIRYLGILDTIRIRKDGYPCRKRFRDFFFRFEEVCWFRDKKWLGEYKKTIKDDNAFRDLALQCLEYLAPKRSSKECLLGQSKIFMKQNFYTHLEQLRLEKMIKRSQSALIIQKMYRGRKIFRWFTKTKIKAQFLINFYRVKKFYIRTQKKRAAAKRIQASLRARSQRKAYLYLVQCVKYIQKYAKGIIVRKKVTLKKTAIAFLMKKMRKFLIRVHEARTMRMRILVYKIYDRAWEYILKKHKFFAAIRIQANVRGYLIKLLHWNKVLQGRKAAHNFLLERASVKIQRLYRRLLVIRDMRDLRMSVDKIRGYWRMKKAVALLEEIRARTILLQRTIKSYYSRKHALDKRIAEYYKEESPWMRKVTFETVKILFPNLIHVGEAESRDRGSELFEEAILGSFTKKRYFKEVLPEYDPYAEMKVTPFAKILDIDIYIDSNEIYENLWAREFERIFNSNMIAKTPIQIIHTGACHTVAINSKGKLFSWGWNNYGQCGLGSYSTYTNIILPSLKLDKNGNLPSIPVVNYFQSGRTIPTEDIGNLKQVTCGEDFTFVTDDAGNTLAFGKNEKGQLGLGNILENDKPTIITELKGKVKEIKSSGDVNLAITTNNELYVWPYETFQNKYKPKRLFLDRKIILDYVSCGNNFAMLLSKNGILYSFGQKNNKGELGTGDYKPRLIPEPISLLSKSGEKIIQVSCGYKHTVAVSANGKAFTWGNVRRFFSKLLLKNSDGQLGIGKYLMYPLPILVAFERVFPSRIKIIQVSAGFRSSFFMNDSRMILYCGVTGTNITSTVPTKLDLKVANPEIADDNEFSPLRILNTWNKSFSIFYATIGDIRILSGKINNKHKINNILNTLAAKWNTESLDAPYIEPISQYFFQSFMKKPKEDKKTDKKNTMKKEFIQKMI